MNQSELNRSLKVSRKILQELEKRIEDQFTSNRLTTEGKASPAVSLENNDLLIQLSKERRAVQRELRILEKGKIEA